MVKVTKEIWYTDNSGEERYMKTVEVLETNKEYETKKYASTMKKTTIDDVFAAYRDYLSTREWD